MNLYKSCRSTLFEGTTRSIKVKKNIFAGFVVKGLNILINLAYIPLLIDFLGVEEYGIWLTLTSIITWFGFFDIGLGNGLRNQLAIAIADGNDALAKKYVSTTYAILSIIFACVLIVFYIVAPLLNYSALFNTITVPNNQLFWLCVVVFTFFVLRLVLQLITIVLLADQRSAFSGLFNLISNFLCFLVILILKHTVGGTIVVMGTILSISPILVFIVASIVLYNSKYKKYAPSFRFVDFSLKSSLIGLGVKFFILQMSDIIIYTTTNFLITQMISSKDVTVYNISYKMFQTVIMGYAILLTPIWSATTDAFAQKDFHWIQNTIKKIRQIGLGLSLIVLIVLLLSDYIYYLWIGNRISIPFYVSFWIAIRTILYLITSAYTSFQNGIGKIQLTVYFAFGQVVFYIPLALFLVQFCNYGIIGILIASILVEIPIKIIQYIQYKKVLNNTAIGIWDK